MNSEYVFALYSGNKSYRTPDERKFPETLLVFDLNGTLIKRFHLDTPCVRIALSENNVIYALSVAPEMHIVKYELNDYL